VTCAVVADVGTLKKT